MTKIPMTQTLRPNFKINGHMDALQSFIALFFCFEHLKIRISYLFRISDFVLLILYQFISAEPNISDPRNAGQAWPRGPGFSGHNNF
jgi:hypothetical protein